VSLISMGVDDASAREALTRNENNLEEALLWLTMTTQDASDSMSESGHHNEDGGGGGADDDDNDDGEEEANQEEGEDAEEEEANQEEDEDAEEEEAVELLERVLGETLQEQHNGNEEYLGNNLDEEWGYIEQYRERTA
jgi:hypothetical protein